MTDIINGQVLAEMLGVTTRHLSNLEKSGAVVKVGRGGYDMRASVRSFCNYLRAQNSQSDEGDYEADKARKMKADADLAELLTAKEGRKLVEIAKIERRWANALSGLRGKCMAMPARIGPMVVIAKSAGDATKLIESELRDAFKSIADDGPDDGAESESEEGEAE